MWYLCWLTLVCGYPNNKLAALLTEAGGAENLYRAVTKDNRYFALISDNLKTWAHFADRNGGRVGSYWVDRFIARARKVEPAHVDDVLEYCDKNNIGIMSQYDADYPESLANISVPPLMLFFQGNREALNMPYMLGVVGSRKCSEYARKVTRRICGELADPALGSFKFVIVSGMAKGADTAAHRGALDSKGMTVGVLACGISVDYPAGSFSLRSEIAECGGAVVTELAPSARPDKYYFAARNRIMSGLCGGTFLTEFAEKSGCHLTAMHAVDQCRDLYYLPPRDIYDNSCAGVITYARDGATPVMSSKDIAAGFGIIDMSSEVKAVMETKVERIAPQSQTGQTDRESFRPEYGQHFTPVLAETKPGLTRAAKRGGAGGVLRSPGDAAEAEAEVESDSAQETGADGENDKGATGRKQEILEILKNGAGAGAVTVDELVLKHGFEIGTLSLDLFDLELGGAVVQTPGNGYKPA